MSVTAESVLHLPAYRHELLIRPLGDQGQYVVKDPRTGEFFHLGEQEHFLLTQLDGEKDAAAACAAFAERFGQPLSEEELDEFVEMARGKGLLQIADCGMRIAESKEGDSSNPQSTIRNPQSKQSLLYWRRSLFDPDRFCTWLEPRIRFFWTRGFLLGSAGCILLALALVWLNRQELAASFASALRWETVVWVWLTLFTVTLLHEFAHGLTCKHHGGEVHEIGFLLMFFMPCFYCNVSDAWLFKEKSKRLWVTFAGGYFELFLWALAVLVWRLTLPGTLVNYLAFIVVATCGVQTLFNFNPLLKLDGYYLLSDALEVPNLRQRGLDHLTGHLRWLLWGAARPERGARGRLLLAFGVASWLFSLTFLAFMLVNLTSFAGSAWGVVGVGATALLGLISVRGVCHGFSAGEASKMILHRRKRTAVWLLVLLALASVAFIPVQERASGPFQVRPAIRAEVRAPVAGFIREVHGDEGDRVSPGMLVVRLEVPDLESRLEQKRAEVRESEARLRLLEVGPRSEEIREQRQRVERARSWRELARQDLSRTKQALVEELARLDQQIAQHHAEREATRDAAERARMLASKSAISAAEVREAEKQYQVSHAQLEQAQAEKRARQAKGALGAEAELARREKELADAEGALTLLEAGSRAEEIDASRAHLARLQEEAHYLEGLQQRVLLHTPVPGIITTPRLKEKVGQYVREGDLICMVEESAGLEAEIALPEQDIARVEPGQAIALKVRALPYENFAAKVERIAPAAGKGELQSTVTIYCRLASAGALRPGMTGHARIATDRRPVAALLIDRGLRYLRTEFWW